MDFVSVAQSLLKCHVHVIVDIDTGEIGEFGGTMGMPKSFTAFSI